ncbi:hypothetical protein A3K64_02175 [Candidatus Micrarchaeota archaeon RBG_16_36_9]|nr:MAG: hypothetical protein A3K64_02175 [Candidatus Micrarchaeota archaeon RBG_16_36_9]
MFFRKNIYQKLDKIAEKISIEPDSFSQIPDLNCRIAENTLKLPKNEFLNFAEAQLLTKKLSKDYNRNIRMPRTAEGYLASKKLGINNGQYEWRSELIDGSFLMSNPDVIPVKNNREYDFYSDKMSLVQIPHRLKDNGDLCWLGISRDEYDRAAFVSSFDNEKYSVCAISPLSRDCLGIRLLIDENKQKKD